MLLLLAQKENRKEVGPCHCQRHRKDNSRLWKGDSTLFQQEWNDNRRKGIANVGALIRINPNGSC